MTPADFSTVLPEVVIAIYAMAALMFAAYTSKDRTTGLLVWVTSAVFLVVALWIGLAAPGTHTAFGGMFIDDGFSRFAKVMILLSAAAMLLMSQNYMVRRGLARFEFPVLTALSVVGMMTMVSAGDLIVLYMGLELQSLALYVLAAFNRDSVRSTEAGLKYFVLGALAAGLLLYGASLVYGFSGTTLFSGIIQTIHDGHMSLGLLFGVVFMLAGLSFKVSAVPFHMWTPDVYEGAPTPITLYFTTCIKVAAMVLIARLLFDAFGAAPGEWGQILALISVASMFLGVIGAIGQRDFKRMMAYSTISHMGFALMALAAGTQQGAESMLIYMAIYVTMNVGTFAFIMTMERDGRPLTDIRSLNMLSKREPLKALALLVLMFSLAGVPPTVGFFAKFYVLKAAVDGGLAWLAVAGVIASVIGAFYYLRIVYYMYFVDEAEGLDQGTMSATQWVCLVGSAAAMVLGMINLFGVGGLAQAAAATLVH